MKKTQKVLLFIEGMEKALEEAIEQDPHHTIKLVGVLKIIDSIKEELK